MTTTAKILPFPSRGTIGKLFFCLAVTFCAQKCWATPVSEFEPIIQACRLAHASVRAPDVMSIDDQTWFKTVFGPASVTYDVRKSDSLVTPIVAQIEVQQVSWLVRATSEVAVKSQEPQPGTQRKAVTRVSFAYLNQRWQFVDARATGQSGRSLTSDTFTETQMTRMKDMRLPISGCFGTV
jgi:hypothetical protein